MTKTEIFMQLHPAVQIVIIIAVAGVIGVWLWRVTEK